MMVALEEVEMALEEEEIVSDGDVGGGERGAGGDT